MMMRRLAFVLMLISSCEKGSVEDPSLEGDSLEKDAGKSMELHQDRKSESKSDHTEPQLVAKLRSSIDFARAEGWGVSDWVNHFGEPRSIRKFGDEVWIDYVDLNPLPQYGTSYIHGIQIILKEDKTIDYEWLRISEGPAPQ